MTVRELIERLNTFDPDLPVVFDDAEWGPTKIDEVSIDPEVIVVGHVEYLRKELTYTTMRNGVEVLETQVLEGFPTTTYTKHPGVVLS